MLDFTIIMSLAITLICHNRPDYLKRVLTSIEANVYVGCQLFVVCDNATPEVKQVINDINWITKSVAHTNLGINYANRHAYRLATMAGFEYVCAVEDDTPLAPDCLQLVRWFMAKNGSVLNCFSGSRDESNPNGVIVRPNFCPWVWAFKSDFFWDVLQAYWMRDHRGWDWSLKAAIEKLGILAMEPVLSRSGNCGRDNGIHYTQEQFDKDFTGHVMSTGRHTDYVISP